MIQDDIFFITSLFSIGNINNEIINEDSRQKYLLTVDVIPCSEGQETITVKKVIILKHYSNSNVKNVIFSKGILSMNKKVNKIIKQKLNYKKELQNRLPEETCNKIWEKIHQRLT
ncbi:MAG: hypothetical protein IIV07_05930, partial [Treponema sp.]|nr:hypothetical protein [Treponema sp.]